MNRRGIVPAKSVKWGVKWKKSDPRAMMDALADLISTGEVERVSVDGDEGEYVALAELLERPTAPPKSRAIILSPFDGLTIDRAAMEHFFNFSYRIECYVPKPKREWGYFVLPILWGDRFIGRIDAKAERKKRVLTIHALYVEPDFNGLDAVARPLAGALTRFAEFNGCDSVRIAKTVPAAAQRLVTNALNS